MSAVRWGLLQTQKPVISPLLRHGIAGHLRGFHNAPKHGVSRGLAGRAQAPDPNSEDGTGMVKRATVFDEVLERSLEDLASSFWSEPEKPAPAEL